MPYRGRKPRDIANRRFGMLVAVTCLGIVEGYRVWLCDCACGRRGVRVRQNKLLRNGKRLSCGCWAGTRKGNTPGR